MTIYKVVKQKELSQLEAEVNQELKKGYIPLGGIQCFKVSHQKKDDVIFLQAICYRGRKVENSGG